MADENFQHGGTNIHYLEKKLGMGGHYRMAWIQLTLSSSEEHAPRVGDMLGERRSSGNLP